MILQEIAQRMVNTLDILNIQMMDSDFIVEDLACVDLDDGD